MISPIPLCVNWTLEHHVIYYWQNTTLLAFFHPLLAAINAQRCTD